MWPFDWFHGATYSPWLISFLEWTSALRARGTVNAAPDLSTRQIALLFKDLVHYVFGASGTVFTNNFLLISIFYPALWQQGFPKFMRAGDLSKLKISKTFYTHYTKVASFDFGEIQTQKTIFFEVRSSLFLHHPVIENCLFQCAVNNLSNWCHEQFFLHQHYTKRIQSSADETSRLVTSSLTSLWVFSCASVLTYHSTRGKSNQFTNLQTHSGLEGILSNYMYLSVQEEGFPVWTSLLLFTVCQTPSVNFDMSNLGPTVTHT